MTKSSSHQTNLALQLKNITKTYHLGDSVIHALKKINVEIEKGELIAVVGSSGSGKSTMLQIAGLLDKPTSGQIYINGHEIKDFSESALAKIRNRDYGFVFQQFNLLAKTSALDNVSLPLLYAGVPTSERQKIAKEMLERVGLGDRLYNTPAQLSGGQQQRVAIARALVNDPQVVFADEPTGNLDSVTGHEIIELLKELNKEGKTIIVVTHEEEVAEIGSRRIVLKDGIVVNRMFRGK